MEANECLRVKMEDNGSRFHFVVARPLFRSGSLPYPLYFGIVNLRAALSSYTPTRHAEQQDMFHAAARLEVLTCFLSLPSQL
jgi:hypothetical protein